MLENLEEALAFLIKMETKGTLGNTFVFTFGKWYFFPLVSLLVFIHYHCSTP